MNILVTGSNGFIGKNLVAWLERDASHRVLRFERGNTWQELEQVLEAADFVFHLAGVNRPQSEEEFRGGNVGLTVGICDRLLTLGRPVPLVLASSSQAILDNPYGISKRQAEEVVSQYAQRSGAHVAIYRLKNVFGKWCRPNYNSAVATFCHNIARDLPITISDPNRKLDLIYVDDVVQHFLQELQSPEPGGVYCREVEPAYQITLGRLVELIRSFRQMRQTLMVPDLGEPFVRKLYGTYLAYLPPDNFAYGLDQKCDPRGSLAEFIKTPSSGQIFVSRTAPGVTRGNHYHHTKTEKFLVLEGEAVIRFRHLRNDEVIEYHVRGEEFRVVDIPPGYTHSIENVGGRELVTLFWASEVFDPDRPDTYGMAVR
ncbi:MAG TPA: capsular biosynthesis protein [Chloroflexi bacterium]|nr:capsular biosynthesis protein [Chloroflexota bacterium]